MATDFCQSCGMPLETEDVRGTERDGTRSADYCKFCYENGAFTSEVTMEQMVETCVPFSLESGVYPDAEAARQGMLAYFPTLKRWKRA